MSDESYEGFMVKLNRDLTFQFWTNIGRVDMASTVVLFGPLSMEIIGGVIHAFTQE